MPGIFSLSVLSSSSVFEGKAYHTSPTIFWGVCSDACAQRDPNTSQHVIDVEPHHITKANRELES
jgi:hypothetical protein